jgi:tripartite-type tricarboxylate transporter receptor subunit TctC
MAADRGQAEVRERQAGGACRFIRHAAASRHARLHRGSNMTGSEEPVMAIQQKPRATSASAIPCLCMLALAALIADSARAQEWKPGKNVEIVVASAAGGSSDRTARVLQRLLQANAAFPSVSVIGPKGMTPPQVSFRDQAFAKAIQGEDWKQDVEKNAWAEDYMRSAETRRHLESEYELMSKMLADLTRSVPLTM